MHMQRGSATVDDNLAVASAPTLALRGHQLGFRPKCNSLRCLGPCPLDHTFATWLSSAAMHRVNTTASDDDADSLHFPGRRWNDDWNVEACGWITARCWIWYPALDKDYSDSKTVEFALAEWGAVFFKAAPH